MNDFLNMEELEAGIKFILESPKDNGKLELIVIRPDVEQRKILSTGELSTVEGLVGDSWIKRPDSKTPDKKPRLGTQITIMNSRVTSLITKKLYKSEKEKFEKWSLAGDQFFVDMDLSYDNLPPGTKLSLGNAEIEISSDPHNGCEKFKNWYGKDARDFVNSEMGKKHNFRGIQGKVIKNGSVGINEIFKKIFYEKK